MANTEPTDETHPHPGQRVYMEDVRARKFSDVSSPSSSPSSSKRPSFASLMDPNYGREGTSRDETASEAFAQKQQGIEIRDFATKKSKPSGKKGDVEQSRQLLERSSLM
jgi:hypothetical protein